jgi:hypothetical protein
MIGRQGGEGVPDDLYQRDIVVWSRRQADLLRRLASGERLNEAVDWPNVIEEIEALGRSQLQACESLLLQAFVHLLKLHLYPESDAVGRWRQEVAAFLTGARRKFTPSMQQLLDLQDIYKDAIREVRAAAEDRSTLDGVVRDRPYSLADLFAEDLDISGLLHKLVAEGPHSEP